MKSERMKTFKNIVTKSKLFYTALIILCSYNAFSQIVTNNQTESTSVYSNPLFMGLLSIIILLLIIIIVLAGALKSVASFTVQKSKSNKVLSVIILFTMLSLSKNTFAQTVEVSISGGYLGLNTGLFYTMLAVIGFEILFIIVLVNSIQILVKKENEEVINTSNNLVGESSILEKLNASVSIEKEEEILFDHEYDGIRELDNDLPPWWKYGFYLTIIFAFIYLVHYHVTATGDLQIKEYDKSVMLANIAKEEYAKKVASNVDENTVTIFRDDMHIEKGKTIYLEMCSACHGRKGEGGIGPNLTDDFWLHGGSIKDVFKTIKYGWPEKGMKAWQSEYSPIEIQEVSSYIKTLNGTNPANAKEKQGDFYTESTDSTKVDSIPHVVVDSMKLEEKK